MPYKNCKIYFDGSNYIAIPSENFSQGKKRSKSTTTPHKAEFETAYMQSQALPQKERKNFITEQLKSKFNSSERTKQYVEQNLERKKVNAIKRRIRLYRKVQLQQWNYFVTFTFSNELHTEQTFKKKLMNTLKHLVSRKGWKYIGVWERSPEKQRLHFHGIFYIPAGAMIGALEQVTDYDTRKHRKQTTYQNSHFLKHFGRNDFKELSKQEIDFSVRYLLKYIEKSGERIVYGGKLPTYFVSSILNNDVICPYGVADKKLLLFDDFTCIDDDGVVWGKATPEVIKKMPKTN